MTLSLREFHPRRVEVRAARVIISRTARYHNSQFSIIHSQLFNPKNPISIDAIIRLRLFCCKLDNFMLIFS